MSVNGRTSIFKWHLSIITGFQIVIFILTTSLSFAQNNIPKNFNPTLKGYTLINNKGQIRNTHGDAMPEVLFKSSLPGMDFYVTTSGISYIVYEIEEEGDNEHKKPSRSLFNFKKPKTSRDEIEYKWNRIDLELSEAAISHENAEFFEPQQGELNYYLPHTPNGVLGVKEYKRAVIKNVYPNIDWVFYITEQNELKYDFILHPGANTSVIKMKYTGAQKIEALNNGKTLRIKSDIGEIIEGELLSYSAKNHVNTIESRYLVTNNEVSFEIKNHNGLEGMVIDPLVKWSTFFGGTSDDGGWTIDIDNAGNIAVAGELNVLDFPVSPTGQVGYQGTYKGGWGFHVSRFNWGGVRLWSTIYDGSGDDGVRGISCDPAGNIYCNGYSRSTDLVLINPGGGAYFQNTVSGVVDVLVLKYATNGALIWSTLLGGTNVEEGYGITCDNLGNTFITGRTLSSDFPTVNPGGAAYFQNAQGGGTNYSDAFIVKFNSSCNMLWSTYYGGSSMEFGKVMAADKSTNDIYVGINTESTDFPTQNPGGGAYFQSSYAGKSSPGSMGTTNTGDLGIVKFNNNGSRISSTYYGGTDAEDIGTDGFEVDKKGDLYIHGSTLSTNFPTFNPGSGAFFQSTNKGAWDTYVLRFSKTGVRKWATYYGGSDWESMFAMYFWGGITISDNGDIWISGGTLSKNFPVQSQACSYNLLNNSGGSNIYLIQFDSLGVRKWGTYYGTNISSNYDASLALKAYKNCVVLTGESHPGYPTVDAGGGAYYQPVNKGGGGEDDCFLLKFCNCDTIPIIANITGPVKFCPGNTATLTADPGYITYQWSNGSTAQNITVADSGTYWVKVTDCCGIDTAWFHVTFANGPIAKDSIMPPLCNGNTNGSISLTLSGGQPPYNYSWNGGGTSANLSNIQAGNYTVTISDADGCSSTKTFSVTQPLAIQVSDTLLNISCYGANNGEINLSAQGGVIPYQYSWQNGNTSDSLSGLNTGTYQVTISDKNGCTQTKTYTITQPQPYSVNTTSNSTPCSQQNGSAGVTVSGNNSPYSYSWSNQSNATTSIVTGLSGGIYTITITDAKGCKKDTTVIINTTGGPQVNLLASDTIGCYPLCLVFTNLGQSNANYQWNFGDGKTANEENPQHCYENPGVYSVQLIITDNNGCSNSFMIQNYIEVLNRPIAQFTTSTDKITEMDSQVEFTNQSQHAQSYSWNFGDNNTDTLHLHPTHTYSVTDETTSFTACLTAINELNCADSVCHPIKVVPDISIYVPNTFTPNQDGRNELFYPVTRGLSELDMWIYDRWGNEIFHCRTEGGDINISNCGWDGKVMNGASKLIAQIDTYVWVIKAMDQLNKMHSTTGHVNILK